MKLGMRYAQALHSLQRGNQIARTSWPEDAHVETLANLPMIRTKGIGFWKHRGRPLNTGTPTMMARLALGNEMITHNLGSPENLPERDRTILQENKTTAIANSAMIDHDGTPTHSHINRIEPHQQNADVVMMIEGTTYVAMTGRIEGQKAQEMEMVGETPDAPMTRANKGHEMVDDMNNRQPDKQTTADNRNDGK